ncbi:MAG: AzlD domain-containing protein [Butyrivibrio sp.]|nr:AzlD domain-containing protein [Butyrivibrio sp.]
MNRVYLYIFVMAAVTYAIRVLPILLIRRKITSPFLRSFLYYMPYATLAAMTFPAILSAAGGLIPSLAGFVVAVILGLRGKSLPVVAIAATAAALIVSFL